jgi:hypothetical protein
MPKFKATQAQLDALEVFKTLLKDVPRRREYVAAAGTDEKQAVFDAKKSRLGEDRLRNADYAEIKGPARQLLETLSDSELALLSDVDDAFVRSGLSVEASPGFLMVH